MGTWRELRLLAPEPLRGVSGDLVAVVSVAALTNVAVFAPLVSETALRGVLGVPFLVFVPGYAFVSALFPEASDPVDTAGGDSRGIDGVERVGLSFGFSVALVALVSFLLNFTPWGIALVPVMVVLTGLTLGLVAVAGARRQSVPESDRFRTPFLKWSRAAWAELVGPDTRTDLALNLLVVFSVLLAVSSVGYAVINPKDGEEFTELYLLTETEEGELVAQEYPTNFTAGERRSVVAGVTNHEHRPVNYTLVVTVQRVRLVGNTTQVLETRRVEQFQQTVPSEGTWHRPVVLDPAPVEPSQRILFLLYKGSPTEPVSAETAYRSVHLWVNVSGTSS